MTYVFDLDGTLCETEGMEYHSARPIMERIRRVNELYEQGHTIIIDTARGSGSGVDWTKHTRYQLNQWGVKYHKVRCGEKAVGDIYVDDRALSDAEFFGA